MNNEDDPVDREVRDTQPGSWPSFVYLNGSTHPEKQAQSQADTSAVADSSTALEALMFPLAATKAGDRVRILTLNCGESNSRLVAMGLTRGEVLEVVSRTGTGSVIVALQDRRLGLGMEMAQQIRVVDAAVPFKVAADRSSVRRTTEMESVSQHPALKLRDAAIGSKLKVVGYEPTARDYKRKLLAMGLTPGAELWVKRHAPMGDPTEIEVRGFRLSLRKDEADALIVEFVGGAEQ